MLASGKAAFGVKFTTIKKAAPERRSNAALIICYWLNMALIVRYAVLPHLSVE